MLNADGTPDSGVEVEVWVAQTIVVVLYIMCEQ